MSIPYIYKYQFCSKRNYQTRASGHLLDLFIFFLDFLGDFYFLEVLCMQNIILEFHIK